MESGNLILLELLLVFGLVLGFCGWELYSLRRDRRRAREHRDEDAADQ